MNDLPVVVLKIMAMFLVMALGWGARRGGYITDSNGQAMSRMLVDFIFPALVFTQMLASVNLEILRAGWYLPLAGIAIMVIAEAVGLAAVSAAGGGSGRKTAVFLVAMPNWIYLPLPIVQGLFGAAGVRDILLYNAGFQLALWTIGVWTLRSSAPDLKSLKVLLMNPGLLATAAGIALAVVFPAGTMAGRDAADLFSPGLLGLAAFQALEMIGSLTIPLSLLVTGVQLWGLKMKDYLPTRSLWAVLAGRLVLAPLVTVLVFELLALCGLRLAEVPRMTGYLIAAMPVAISCSIVTERFAGETDLAAKSIFYSTLASIATVPVFYCLVKYCCF